MLFSFLAANFVPPEVLYPILPESCCECWEEFAVLYLEKEFFFFAVCCCLRCLLRAVGCLWLSRNKAGEKREYASDISTLHLSLSLGGTPLLWRTTERPEETNRKQMGLSLSEMECGRAEAGVQNSFRMAERRSFQSCSPSSSG